MTLREERDKKQSGHHKKGRFTLFRLRWRDTGRKRADAQGGCLGTTDAEADGAAIVKPDANTGGVVDGGGGAAFEDHAERLDLFRVTVRTGKFHGVRR